MKAKFYLSIIIAMCGISLMFNACKNKDCTKDGSCAAEFYRFELGEAKSYLWALPGSYWIYKNALTGDLDTHIVTQFAFDSLTIKGTQPYGRFKTVKYDKLLRMIYSTCHKQNYYDQTITPQPDGTSFNGTYRIIINRTGAGLSVPFFYPFLIGAWSGTGSSDTYCRTKDSAMSVNAKIYSGIAKFEVTPDRTWNSAAPSYTSKFYWAKDVGVIQMTKFSPTTENWQLMDYHIVK